jgi:hypothetical protein
MILVLILVILSLKISCILLQQAKTLMLTEIGDTFIVQYSTPLAFVGLDSLACGCLGNTRTAMLAEKASPHSS